MLIIYSCSLQSILTNINMNSGNWHFPYYYITYQSILLLSWCFEGLFRLGETHYRFEVPHIRLMILILYVCFNFLYIFELITANKAGILVSRQGFLQFDWFGVLSSFPPFLKLQGFELWLLFYATICIENTNWWECKYFQLLLLPELNGQVMPIFATIHIVLLIHIDCHQHAAEVVPQLVIYQKFYVTIQVLKQFSEILMADGSHFV